MFLGQSINKTFNGLRSSSLYNQNKYCFRWFFVVDVVEHKRLEIRGYGLDKWKVKDRLLAGGLRIGGCNGYLC